MKNLIGKIKDHAKTINQIDFDISPKFIVAFFIALLLIYFFQLSDFVDRAGKVMFLIAILLGVLLLFRGLRTVFFPRKMATTVTGEK